MKRCALALALGTSVHGGDLIDFETLPDGTPTVDLQEIGLEYAEFGVTFTMINAAGDVIGTPNIAKVGAPQTAFASCLGADTPQADQDVGDTFLTDNTSLGISGRLLITYASPVAQAAGVILDTDCRNGGNPPCEQWTITAHDAKGTVLDTFVIDGPVGPVGPPCNDPNGPGDALAAGWFFDRAEADVFSVIIEYTGAATSVGLAFDNFTPSSIPDFELIAFESATNVCFGQPVTLTADVNGGIPPYDFSWQRQVGPDDWEEFATTAIASVAPPVDTTYRVVVMDGTGETLTSLEIPIGVTPVTYALSQESAPGLGDFGENPLGTIDPYVSDQTALDYYGWTGTATPFSGPDPALTNDRCHLFMVANSDGLALYVVYDDTAGTGGGRAEMALDFDCETATYVARDDATGDASDIFEELNDGSLFHTRNVWAANRTDGFAIGALDCEWTATIEFTDLFGGDPTFNGLQSWIAFSNDGSETALALEEDRRVRIAAIIGCPWDLDGDGAVAVTDLVAVIVAWGPCGEEACPADFDCSGAVDVADLVEVIINWGPCD